MVKVLLVDDHELVRSGIEHLLNESSGIGVVGVASSGEEAIDKVESLRPDVILMDISMPGIGGIEASRKISQKHPEIKIIALSVHADGPFPHHLLRAGAHGFISKSCPVTELITAIWSVYRGKKYLSTDVANQLALASLPGNQSSPFDSLSQREMQIVILTLQSKSIQEIAEMLSISPKTVNTYRYRVYEKVAVKNDVELTRLATKYKLITDTAG
jgi:two-component system invasion response regulator UvrY